MKRKILGGLAVAAMLAGGLALTSGTATAVVQDEGPPACYVQVEQAQYKKFVADTDAGPWTIWNNGNTWWKDQANVWHANVGEVAAGPGPHSAGRFTYRRTAQQTVNGDVIPCPIPASSLGLTYNQD